ncbi:MAG TPA: YaeQ family protein [Burkholderiales bacterium]|nr:YaeQ family protein [Burkholderiales bacterium]
MGDSGHAAQFLWQRVGDKLARSHNLTVINLPQAGTQALARLTTRNMQLQVTIQDGQVWVADERDSVQLVPQKTLGSKPDWS